MRLFNTYKKLQLLSLDVVGGACLMAFATSLVLNVVLPWSIYFCLGGAVWLVYTIDHLLDARQIQEKVVTSRHAFHYKHYGILIKIWLSVLVLLLIVTINWLPVITIKFGLFAATMVIIHLVLVKLLGTRLSIIVQKEFGVAIAYVIGVIVGPLSLADELSIEFYVFIGQIFLLAFINLLEFSYFDKRVDQLQGQVSLSVILGRKRLKAIIAFLLLVSFVISVYSFVTLDIPIGVQGVLTLSWLVLSVIMFLPKTFIKNDYYRIFGDMVFLFPILLL